MTEKKLGRKRNLKSESDGNGKAAGLLVGLDIGYGFTKILCEDGKRVMFPSVVAGVAPTMMSSIGDVQAEDEVVVERLRCIVGERAIGKDDRYSNLHNLWWTSMAYKAIIAHAKKWIPVRSSIVTGLPFKNYIAPDSRDIVREIVKSALHAQDVLIVPQGVGAYFSDPAFASPTTKVAIVDIGTWTTELIGMTGRDLLGEASAGHVLGVHDILATVAQELTPKLGRVVDPYEVERAHRGEAEIRYQGRAYPHDSIQERVTQLAKDRASQILTKMTDLWGPHAAAFESILFCGGGAKLLFPFLKQFRDGCVLMPDAQYANTRGYLAIAEYKYGSGNGDESSRGAHELKLSTPAQTAPNGNEPSAAIAV
ncbi:MAG: ParM/StbA family protein [Nitrospirota bacterium]|nr:ParM/StbA family protein [Nitrospirota bacterium]MDE3219549.1 ParM/StbA family protein [Nitrospirota bacterium]